MPDDALDTAEARPSVERDYLELLLEAMTSGEPHDDRTGVGTASLFARQLRHAWSDGFPLLTTKRVPLRVVAEELRWMMAGRTDTRWLNERGVTIWDEWADEVHTARWGRPPGELGPTYGAMLRAFPSGGAKHSGGWEACENEHVDQLSSFLRGLVAQPGSRRHVLTLWHPHWATRVDVPPCLLSVVVKCHEPPHSRSKQLSLHATFRSSDLFLGLPFDLAAMGLLQALLCQETRREPRELALTLIDAHLYNNHRSAAGAQLSRQPRRLPTLAVDYRSIDDWRAWVDGYCPHPAIKADVAV